jgi:hypothetical protein
VAVAAALPRRALAVSASLKVGILARREVALVAEAGEESLVAVSQSLRLGGRGVQLAALRGRPWSCCRRSEEEALADLLGQRPGA